MKLDTLGTLTVQKRRRSMKKKKKKRERKKSKKGNTVFLSKKGTITRNYEIS
jgi:hypothetical protein